MLLSYCFHGSIGDRRSWVSRRARWSWGGGSQRNGRDAQRGDRAGRQAGGQRHPGRLVRGEWVAVAAIAECGAESWKRRSSSLDGGQRVRVWRRLVAREKLLGTRWWANRVCDFPAEIWREVRRRWR